MRRWLCIGFSIAAGILRAQSWSAGSQIPLGSSGSTGVIYTASIYAAYDPSATALVAAWSDSSTQLPYYSTYSGGSWTTAAIPSGSSAVDVELFLAYDEDASNLVGAWDASNGQRPYYSIYNRGSWLTDSELISSNASRVTNGGGNVFVAYNPNTSTVIAAWPDGSTNTPYFSSYDGVSTWTTNQLSTTGSSGTTVCLAYSSNTAEMMAIWRGSSDQPYYALYSSGTTWTTEGEISLGLSNGVYTYPSLVYDLNTTMLIAAWVDSVSQVPYYSVYSGGTWRTSQISLGSSGSTGANGTITLAYDPTITAVIAAWSDSSTQAPYYSTYSDNEWTTPAEITLGDSAGANIDVHLAYDTNTKTMIAVWSDTGTNNVPYYSIFTPPSPPPPSPPPPPPPPSAPSSTKPGGGSSTVPGGISQTGPGGVMQGG